MGILLVILSYIDIKKKEIPIWGIALSIALAMASFWLSPEIGVIQRLSGGMLGVGMLLLGKMTKEAIGYGDGWLLLGLGLYLGFLEALHTLIIAFWLCAILAIVIWIKERRLGQNIPFVPFLCLAYCWIQIGGAYS